MSDSIFQPVHINHNDDVYLRLEISGVPWYIYNDHIDRYYRNKGDQTSILIQKMTVDSTSKRLVLGGVPISPTLESNDDTQPTYDHNEKDVLELSGAVAWHSSSDLTETAFIGYLRSSPVLSDVFRTVNLEAEYVCRAVSGHPEEMYKPNSNLAEREFEVIIRVQSLIGASRRDGAIESYRDRVPEGQGSFRIVLKRLAGTDGTGNGYAIVGVDGVRLYQELEKTDQL